MDTTKATSSTALDLPTSLTDPKSAKPKLPWVPLSYLRWCALYDELPNACSAVRFVFRLDRVRRRVLRAAPLILVGDDAANVRAEGEKRVEAVVEAWAVLAKSYVTDDAITCEPWSGYAHEALLLDEWSHRFGIAVNALVQLLVQLGDKPAPVILHCSSERDAGTRYGGLKDAKDKETLGAMLDTPSEAGKKPLGIAPAQYAPSLNSLLRFAGDMLVLRYLDGMVIDTRHAADVREAVTEPEQRLGGLRSWHLDVTGKLKLPDDKPVASLAPARGVLYCRQFAQISEAMYLDPALPKVLEKQTMAHPETYLEYTAPGIVNDYQSRAVLCLEPGCVGSSPGHYDRYFRFGLNPAMRSTLETLRDRLVPWAELAGEKDEEALQKRFALLDSMQHLPKWTAEEKKPGKKEKAPSPDEAGPLLKAFMTIHDAMERLAPKDDVRLGLLEKRGILKVFKHDRDSMAGRGFDGDADADALKTLAAKCTALAKSQQKAPLVKQDLEKASAALTDLHTLLASTDHIGQPAVHASAVANHVWYVLVQEHEGADFKAKHEGRKITLKDSTQGDHLLNDLLGRLSRAETYTGIRVLPLDLGILRAMREARALRSEATNSPAESNAKMWSFAGDYFEWAIHNLADCKDAKTICSVAEMAFLIAVRGCLDLSSALRIDADYAHKATTNVVPEPKKAKAVALSILQHLRREAPRLARLIADDLARVNRGARETREKPDAE